MLLRPKLVPHTGPPSPGHSYEWSAHWGTLSKEFSIQSPPGSFRILKWWVCGWICFQICTYKNISWDNILLRSQEPSRKVLYVKATLFLERVLENYVLMDLYCSSSLVSMRPLGTLLQSVIVLKLLWIVLRDHQVSSYNHFTQQRNYWAKLLVLINVTLVTSCPVLRLAGWSLQEHLLDFFHGEGAWLKRRFIVLLDVIIFFKYISCI